MDTMNKIREILNEIKWRRRYDLNSVRIFYIHRGAPNDIKEISGDDITSIQKTFLEIDDTMIPHHRIMKIIYEDSILFDRKKDTSSISNGEG